jgi:phage tail-like protein
LSNLFAQRLLELLPSVWRERDTQGDLAAFLGVPGPTLDEIQALADAIPTLADVDECDARYLPSLAALVGAEYDPKRDTDAQRRAICDAVEGYRRKATLPAMRLALERLGWQGNIEETFRQTLRLNRRARVNRQKLSGEIFSLGVYRLVSETNILDIRQALLPHHPAGTRRFFVHRDAATCMDAGPREAINHFLVTRWPAMEGIV